MKFRGNYPPLHRHSCGHWKSLADKKRGIHSHGYWHFGLLCAKPHRLCDKHMAEHKDNWKPGPSKSHIACEKEREESEKRVEKWTKENITPYLPEPKATNWY